MKVEFVIDSNTVQDDEHFSWCVHTYQLNQDADPINNDYKYCGFEKKIEEERYALSF